jgi:peptide deformylase
MLKTKDILDEKDKKLHQISKEVKFPLEEEDIKLINDSLEYLRLSQDEEKAEELNLRAGMGLAFPQLGKLKRIFVISYKTEEGNFIEYTVINPTIISYSNEMIYVEEGEGCLSVNRDVEGIIPRHARITVGFHNIDGTYREERVREEIAVAFQHEKDHLDGILFTDRIDKTNPYKNMDKMRSI